MFKHFKQWNNKTIFPDRDAKIFFHRYLTYPRLCNALRDRIVIKKDAVVLITAPTSLGKSTLAGKLCFDHFEYMDNVKVPGEKMYSDDNFIVDPEDYAKRMIKDKGNVLWWDESRDGLSSKNWNKEINKTIVSRKNKNRKRGIISFILLPYESEVDKSFLKHITMWIWIKKRGVAQIFVAANARMGGHSLDIQSIIDRQNKWLKENPNKRVVPPIMHPEYIGNIFFGALTNKQEKRYDFLVDKHHAAGKEIQKGEELNPQIDSKEAEKQIPIVLDEVEVGTIKSKRDMWDKLKELTKFEDALLIRHINRHLKIRGFKNFNSFEI